MNQRETPRFLYPLTAVLGLLWALAHVLGR